MFAGRMVDDTFALFNELQLQHQAVATKTKTLHDAFDRLLVEKQKLIEFAEALHSKLNYFDELENVRFILSNYVVVFKTLVSYEQVMRHQICSLLMTSLCTNSKLEGEAGEPIFRRLVLQAVAHIIRLYSSSLITECKGFCVEARTLGILFQNSKVFVKLSSSFPSVW